MLTLFHFALSLILYHEKQKKQIFRTQVSADCPPALVDLTIRCLRSDPQQRPSSDAIVKELETLKSTSKNNVGVIQHRAARARTIGRKNLPPEWHVINLQRHPSFTSPDKLTPEKSPDKAEKDKDKEKLYDASDDVYAFRILKYVPVESSKEGTFVVYLLEVTSPGGSKTELYKRYSLFAELHEGVIISWIAFNLTCVCFKL